MERTDDRPGQPLPVTAEVGSEGGSYADKTIKNETFGRKETDRREAVVDGEIGTPASGGMTRYPTEPPPSAGEDRRSGSSTWGFGLLGAAAGLAVGFLAGRRK